MRGKLARAALLSVVLALFGVAAHTTPASAASIIINTHDGRVRGLRQNGVREFLGVPYAAPPVGNLRWRAPEAHMPWKTVFDATHKGSFCPQFLPGAGAIPMSEDCLILNVYAPDSSRTGLPVMVWIHGGAFIFGSGASFDGSALARKHKQLVVTINYRLGALGFLALPSRTDNPNHISGNYGLLDQQAALQWVKRNIGAFGGDPAKVTVAGESAGGISICAQMVSPGAAGLFRGAIIESGPCLHQATIAEGEKTGREMAVKLGCDKAGDEAACLRSKSAQQVLAAMPGSLQGPLLWAPIVDGQVLPRQPLEAFRSGTFNKVPVINGSNRDEGTLFIALGRPVSKDDYAAAVGSFARLLAPSTASRDDQSAKVLAEYPLEQYESPSLGLAAVLGDGFFSCQIERTNQLLSAFVRTYEYEFNDRHAPSTLIPYPPFPLGAYHSAEIQYVFQTYFPSGQRTGSPDFSARQRALSDQIAAYWSRFVATSNPDDASPAWIPVKPRHVAILSLAPDGIGYESDFLRVHHCALWDLPTGSHRP